MWKVQWRNSRQINCKSKISLQVRKSIASSVVWELRQQRDFFQSTCKLLLPIYITITVWPEGKEGSVLSHLSISGSIFYPPFQVVLTVSYGLLRKRIWCCLKWWWIRLSVSIWMLDMWIKWLILIRPYIVEYLVKTTQIYICKVIEYSWVSGTGTIFPLIFIIHLTSQNRYHHCLITVVTRFTKKDEARDTYV